MRVCGYLNIARYEEETVCIIDVNAIYQVITYSCKQCICYIHVLCNV